MDPITTEEVERAIFQQKVGCTARDLKAYKQHQAEGAHRGDMLLMKKAKMDTRSRPEWKGEEGEQVERPNNEDENEGLKHGKNYSRILERQACGKGIETKNKQLLVQEGFRARHCIACGHQARSKGHMCQCGVIWHECQIHQQDPKVHRSRKAPNKPKKADAQETPKDSDRPAPGSMVKRPRAKMQPRTKQAPLHAHGTKVEQGPMKHIMPAVLERHRKRKQAITDTQREGNSRMKLHVQIN